MPATTTTSPSFDDRLVSFLSDPASFPEHPRTVELVRTHISYVALTEAHAYKVARPVDFGFVNFSTLEKRRLNADRAIELNRRLCPDVYLNVIPIVEREGVLRFADPGEDTSDAVEFAVHMRRMSAEGFFDRRLREGRVSRSDWDRLIALLVEFYRKQPVERAVSGNARPEKLRDIVLANVEPAAELPGAGTSAATAAALAHYFQRYFGKQSHLLEQRVQQGWIRDGHGDLRPEHIHLSDDCVRIFDCVEFSDRLRHIDIASDVAFLLMELDFTGHAAESRRVCAAFADALEDHGQSGVLDFYKCYRACVRGKVGVLQARDVQISATDREKRQFSAKAYYRLALNYAVHGSKPILVAIMGRIATGKTTLANLLANELGCEAYDSDRVRKQLFGLPLGERPPESVRQKLYSRDMTDQTYARLIELAKRQLERGQCVILDATFSQIRHRTMLRDLAQAVDCDLCLLELDAPDDVILARLRERERQCGVISDARAQDFERLAALYEPPLEFPSDKLITLRGPKPETHTVEAALLALVERNASRAGRDSLPSSELPRPG